MNSSHFLVPGLDMCYCWLLLVVLYWEKPFGQTPRKSEKTMTREKKSWEKKKVFFLCSTCAHERKGIAREVQMKTEKKTKELSRSWEESIWLSAASAPRHGYIFILTSKSHELFFYETFFSLSARCLHSEEETRRPRDRRRLKKSLLLQVLPRNLSASVLFFVCTFSSSSKVCFFPPLISFCRVFFFDDNNEKRRDGFSNEISLKTLAEVVSQTVHNMTNFMSCTFLSWDTRKKSERKAN